MATTRRIRLGLLEAGPLAPHLAERYGSHSAFFRAYLGSLAPEFEFTRFRVYEDEWPADAAAQDAYLVTGSRYSVYEALDWIARLKQFVRDAAEVRPLVGICFGHQIVAEAFGGKVAKAPQGWGIGVHRYGLTRTAPYMQPARDNIALIASHQDQVVVPPAGADVLAGSSFCPIGAMQIGANVLTLQLHPEMPVAYSRDLYEMRRSLIGSAKIDAALASLQQPNDADAVAHWIIAFLRERVGACAPQGRD